MLGFQPRLKEPKYAVAYPFLRNHIENIFNGKNVVCKYAGRGKPNLVEGSKVLFYASGGGFEVLGEGAIRRIEFLTPLEILTNYRSRLFISSADLEGYRGNRPVDKKLLVLTLTSVRRFSIPIKMTKYVTMAGQMFDKSQYEAIATPESGRPK